jgi:nicotinamide riboside transporter PnuC
MFGHHHHHHHEAPPPTWKDGIFLKVSVAIVPEISQYTNAWSLIKIINIIVFFFFLGSNAYAFTSPVAGGKDTYITPAAWSYWIW